MSPGIEPFILLDKIHKITHKTPILFIHSYYINQYLSLIQKIKIPFIVITTSNDDIAFPLNFNVNQIIDILDNSPLVKWFSKNPSMVHPKIEALPIGAKYHWVSTDFFGEDKTNTNRILSKYGLNPKKRFEGKEKPNLLYYNYGIHTTDWTYYPAHVYVRIYVKNILSKRFSFLPNQDFEEYIKTLSTYKFSISPPGRGIDTHRAWESLMVGTIPIMMHTPLDNMFCDLPVVFVNDWEEITEDFLKKKYIELKDKTYNFDKCYCDYWVKYMNSL